MPSLVRRLATSAQRSVPETQRGEVSATSAPNRKAASAIRMSSVAMITEAIPRASRARSQTCCTRGLPARRWRGFPGKRVEAHLAGMMTAILDIGVNVGAIFSDGTNGTPAWTIAFRIVWRVRVSGHRFGCERRHVQAWRGAPAPVCWELKNEATIISFFETQRCFLKQF